MENEIKIDWKKIIKVWLIYIDVYYIKVKFLIRYVNVLLILFLLGK